MTVSQSSNPLGPPALMAAAAPCPARRRRAFATIMAVVLIGLVVTSLVAVTAAVTADVRRTRQLGADTQFRQLLLAGAADAAAHAKTWGEAPTPQSWALALPEALTEQGYRVQLSVVAAKAPAGADTVEVRVDAAGPTLTKLQTLQFVRSAEEWKLRDVGRGNND
jgi:hypothetical protein